MDRVVILDGDDTLWSTQELYEDVKRRFAKLMEREIPSVGDVIPRLEAIDAHRVAQHQFSPARFVGSMLILYSQVSKEHNQLRRKATVNRIRGLAASIAETPRLYEDTTSTLAHLSRSYQLVLATKGQPKVQQSKVKRLGLKRYFTKIYFLRQKTPREYRMILADLAVPYDRAWVIGNSIKSDINPALQIGLRAIWIPKKTWTYEEAPPRAGPIHRANSLSQASRIIASLDGG